MSTDVLLLYEVFVTPVQHWSYLEYLRTLVTFLPGLCAGLLIVADFVGGA